MSPARNHLNTKIIPNFAQIVKGKTLFVGVDSKWDYRTLFQEYVTLDIDPGKKPDIVGDIVSCPQIQDNSFDAVILIGVYEYVAEKERMFSEIWRILKPGGKVLASLPAKMYYQEDHKHFDFKDMNIFTGFKIEKIMFTYYREQPYYYHFFLRK